MRGSCYDAIGKRHVLVCCRPEPDLIDFTDVRQFAAGDELASPTLPIRVPVAALSDGVSEAAG